LPAGSKKATWSLVPRLVRSCCCIRRPTERLHEREMKEESQTVRRLETIMNVLLRRGGHQRVRRVIGIVCAILLAPYNAIVTAQQAQQPAEESVKIPADQLDALVAPIALYPDPLLSQTLVASTYPLEIMQLQQWFEKNKGISDKALVDAVSKQSWDPSIQAMAALPQVVKRLTDDIQWTSPGRILTAHGTGRLVKMWRAPLNAVTPLERDSPTTVITLEC